MNTYRTLTEDARTKFRGRIKGRLASRRITVTALAHDIGYSRNAVSRAINRGEFPEVQKAIRNSLGL